MSGESSRLVLGDGRRVSAASVRTRGQIIAVRTVIQYLLLVVSLFLSFVPILLMLSMSLRNTTLIYVDFWALPWPIEVQNYNKAFLLLTGPAFRTLFVYVGAEIGILGFSLLSSYAFARLDFPGRQAFFLMILAVMMIPGTILLTPLYILAQQLQLRDSLLGLMVFYIAGGQPFAIFLIRAFFQSQPAEMFESARIDGATELQALWSIAVPLAWPIIITIAIMNFLSIYNDLIWPMLMLASPGLQTLTLALQSYNPGGEMIRALPDVGGQAAGYVFASIPQLILFVVGMRYFIQGLTSGAVKT